MLKSVDQIEGSSGSSSPLEDLTVFREEFELHCAEKDRRAERIEFNHVEKEKRRASVYAREIWALGQHSDEWLQRDLPRSQVKPEPLGKKQPRHDKWRYYRPGPNNYVPGPETKPIYHDVYLTAKLPSSFPATRQPSRGQNDYELISHQIFFLLEPLALDSEPVRMLQRLDLIRPGYEGTAQTVEWLEHKKWNDESKIGKPKVGRYYAAGCRLSDDAFEQIYRGGIVISAETAKQLHHLLGNNKAGISRLVALGLLSYSGVEEMAEPSSSNVQPQATDRIASMTGLEAEEITPAVIRGYHSKGGGEKIKRATILRRRDLNRVKDPNDPRHRGRKKPYARRSHRLVTRAVRSSSVVSDNDKKVKRGASKVKLAEHERYISSSGSLYRACKYIYTGVAKCQNFVTFDQRLAEGVQTILAYVQSRYDRRLFLDIDSAIRRENAVLHKRLQKWEFANGIDEQINFIRVWNSARRASTGNASGLPEGRVEESQAIPVSRNYKRSPDRYVTNYDETLSAVRRILKGEIAPDHFHILDPRTSAILDYSMEARAHFLDEKGQYRGPDSRKIAAGEVPELRRRLESADLMSLAQFSFRPVK